MRTMNLNTLTLTGFIIAFAACVPAAAQNNALPGAVSRSGLVSIASPALRPVAIVAGVVDPARHTIELDIDLREAAPLAIELIGGGGEREVIPIDAGARAAGRQHVSVPIETLDAGSYLIRLSTPKGLAQQRIEIAR